MLPPIVDAVVAVFLLIGAFFAFVGSLGLAKLPDFYTRLHGPSKATTLGVGATLVGSAVFFSARTGGALSLHEILITFFLFITAPVSAHVLSKAALHLRLPNVSGAPATPDEVPAGDPASPPAPESVRPPAPGDPERRPPSGDGHR